jgi:hypothetical protein
MKLSKPYTRDELTAYRERGKKTATDLLNG